MLEETTLLFQSASLSTGVGNKTPSAKAETPYVGAWKWIGTAPNGRPAVSIMTLKDDLSFSTSLTIEDKLVFTAVGVWSVSGQRIYWKYLRSDPQLPAEKREDEDDIIALDTGRLVLRSKLSGKERVFLLQ